MTGKPEHDPHYEAPAQRYKKGPPVRVVPLDYYGSEPGESKPLVPAGLQFLIGLVMPYGYIALVVLTRLAAQPEHIWFHCAIFVVIASVLSRRLRWKGFSAGVITGILLIPVALFVLCWIALSKI